MTDNTKLVHEGDTLDDSRIELITDYLMGSLDAAQVEAVKLRLETDAEFREYCAPLILAWSVPPKHEREPMSRAELAMHWDNFTKRAGFIHQKRKARRRGLFILGIVALALSISAYLLRGAVREWYVDRRDFMAVPATAGWITLAEGREVQLAPGARLRAAKRLAGDGMLVVKLRGSAQFRTVAKDTTTFPPPLYMVAVQTAAGTAASGNADFKVTARGDTTEAELLPPARRAFIGFTPLPTTLLLTGTVRGPNMFALREGQRARVVRGSAPTLLLP